ncbi:MAG: SDR family NAD(P)-dependent oxidoreductase, partial [Nitrospirae bacterium]
MSCEGKVAIVTGGAQGIGQAIAECLAQAGADVAVVDLDRPRCQETMDRVMRYGRRALAIGANIGNWSEVTN